MRRTSLATRIALLCVGIAVGTALIAAALAANLIRTGGEASARHTLSQLAVAAQAATENAPTSAAQRRLRRALGVLKIQYTTLDTTGAPSTVTPLITGALTPADVTTLLGGQPVSTSRRIGGSVVLVEALPTSDGAVVLVWRRVDAIALGSQAIRRMLVALVVSAGIATAVGLFVAYRLARPLRRTAEAAHALAAGRRDVQVVPGGPAEVAEVAEAVNSLAASLARSEGRQRDFLMSVSHELRTPLTAITGYAESLAEQVVPADQAAAVGRVMLGEAQRLDRLVADLLDLARLEAQDFRIEAASVDLTALVQATAQAWHARCEAAGVSFGVEAPPFAVTAYTDAARVRQVLDGLLQNSLRVTPAGRPIVLAVQLEPAVHPGSGETVLEVRDGGPGLTDDDIAVAFQPAELYRRYRGIRQVGTGLGLAIVHRLVTRLGGNVEAGHAREGGARFTVRLPAAAAATVVRRDRHDDQHE
jgi:two-component system, OmpR family, sensor kinase